MPTNTAVTATLVKTADIPPDQDCPPASANDWLQLAVDYLAVQAQDAQAPASQSNSVADQALNVANQALAQVGALEAAIPVRRTSGSGLVGIASSGDTNVTITWQPDMPNVNYQVNVSIHGPNSATNAPDWVVVENSRVVGGVQIRFLNTPSGNWSFSWEVIAL